MSRKKGTRLKKTPVEAQEYRQFILNSISSSDDTCPPSNKMLTGSDDLGYNDGEVDSVEATKKTPIKYRFIDFIKKNIFPIAITTVVIAIGTATLTNFINIALINQKIEYIERDISELSSNNIDTDTLNLQLENIKKDLDSDYLLKFNDIKWQIQNLEEKVKDIKNE